MTIVLAGLMTFYFLAVLIIIWWIISVVRRQRDNDLRFHRDVLLGQIHNELAAQESRLLERLRPAK